jgi:hypothetical protein
MSWHDNYETTVLDTRIMVVKVDKRTARARYDAGLPIAMAGEGWWFDQPRPCHTFTRVEMRCTFDELHTERWGTTYSYAAPVTP